ADNEIHKNMKADIAEAKAMMKTLAGLTPADLNIHTDFFKSFFIEIPNYTVVSDNEISNQFSAENINAINLKNIQISDLQINKQFYSSK
ncbi:MAG: hypothetical protein ACO28V_04175, partial [Chitinophagaceae bacterium]